MSFKRFTIYWLPVVLWIGYIFLLSSDTFSSTYTSRIIIPFLHWLFPDMSLTDIRMIHAVIRKCMHVIVYFVLTLLLYRAYRGDSREQKTAKWIIASLSTVIVLAAADEYHQSFISTRTPSIGDVGFDVLGGIVAFCVIVLWTRFHKRAG
jgi:VanZ family protein